MTPYVRDYLYKGKYTPKDIDALKAAGLDVEDCPPDEVAITASIPSASFAGMSSEEHYHSAFTLHWLKVTRTIKRLCPHLRLISYS